MTRTHFTIISIEDSEADFTLLKKAIEGIKDLSLDLINIQNGTDAINFLYKKNGHKTAPTPDVIILDINLPRMSGFEILKIIKNDDNLKLIPVIMLSTSDSEKDIKDSYALYANSYILKTFGLKELREKIEVMANYWLKTSELPSLSDSDS